MNNLPDGWFWEKDIEFYREAISSLPDNALILEIGCWKGRSICSVADLIRQKNITAYVIDTFLGSENERNTFHKDAKTMDIEKIFRENIQTFGIEKNVVVLKEDSREAWRHFRDEFFDMIFIDGQHTTDLVHADITNYLPKLKKNGILAGHDYSIPGVSRGVGLVLGKDFVVKNNIWIKKEHNPNKKTILISCWAKPLRNGKWNAKNPTLGYWNELIQLLKAEGYEIWQCGQGPETRLENVDRHIWDKDLWELGEDIKSCSAWISVDNFFHHWALLQFKKRGIVLWSQSDPEIFGHGENINLLQDRKYLRPKQFEVWEAAEHNPDAFVLPKNVLENVNKLINT